MEEDHVVVVIGEPVGVDEGLGLSLGLGLCLGLGVLVVEIEGVGIRPEGVGLGLVLGLGLGLVLGLGLDVESSVDEVVLRDSRGLGRRAPPGKRDGRRGLVDGRGGRTTVYHSRGYGTGRTNGSPSPLLPFPRSERSSRTILGDGRSRTPGRVRTRIPFLVVEHRVFFFFLFF